MRRGEVWWAELPERVGRRPVVLLSRDSAYKVRSAPTASFRTACTLSLARGPNRTAGVSPRRENQPTYTRRRARTSGRVAQTDLAGPPRRSVGAVREPPVGACRFRCKTGGSRAAPTDGDEFGQHACQPLLPNTEQVFRKNPQLRIMRRLMPRPTVNEAVA